MYALKIYVDLVATFIYVINEFYGILNGFIHFIFSD